MVFALHGVINSILLATRVSIRRHIMNSTKKMGFAGSLLAVAVLLGACGKGELVTGDDLTDPVEGRLEERFLNSNNLTDPTYVNDVVKKYEAENPVVSSDIVVSSDVVTSSSIDVISSGGTVSSSGIDQSSSSNAVVWPSSGTTSSSTVVSSSAGTSSSSSSNSNPWYSSSTVISSSTAVSSSVVVDGDAVIIEEQNSISTPNWMDPGNYQIKLDAECGDAYTNTHFICENEHANGGGAIAGTVDGKAFSANYNVQVDLGANKGGQTVVLQLTTKCLAKCR
jgi:hypothetical protein